MTQEHTQTHRTEWWIQVGNWQAGGPKGKQSWESEGK